MFDALDKTLRTLLEGTDQHDGTLHDVTQHGEKHISFETPDANFKPDAQTINLFLHDVSENRELRENAPLRTPVGDKVTFAPPPLRLNCRYLVTAWTGTGTGDNQVFQEHQLLGWALQKLSTYPVIPLQIMDDGLKSHAKYSTWDLPLPTLVAQMESGKPNTDFWQALGISPRVSFELVVTIAMPVFEVITEPAVNRGRLEIGIRDTPGSETLNPSSSVDLVHVYQVLDGAAPVVKAAVKINGAPVTDRDNKPLVTDSLGRFYLRKPPDGEFKILIEPVGAAAKEFAVTAESRKKASEFTLNLQVT